MEYLIRESKLEVEDEGAEKMFFSKEDRIVWKRRLKSFWLDYSHSKIGLAGLVLLTLFVLTAVFSPWMSPFTENEVRSTNPVRQADAFAVPEWFAMINTPMQDWPREAKFPLNWSAGATALPSSIILDQTSTGYRVNYDANRSRSADAVTLTFVSELDYQYAPMILRQFDMLFTWKAEPSNTTKVVIFCLTPSLC